MEDGIRPHCGQMDLNFPSLSIQDCRLAMLTAVDVAFPTLPP